MIHILDCKEVFHLFTILFLCIHYMVLFQYFFVHVGIHAKFYKTRYNELFKERGEGF